MGGQTRQMTGSVSVLMMHVFAIERHGRFQRYRSAALMRSALQRLSETACQSDKLHDSTGQLIAI